MTSIQKLFPEVEINDIRSNTNIPELDGVRGLAIILVICFHCFRFPLGWIGVDLFFVLSGFLITGILLDSKEHKYYFRNFWLRRTLRIFPLYYLVLCLVLLPKLLFKFDTIGEPSFSYWAYVQNWKFTLDANFPTGKGTLNHFWSLAIEEQFYFIFPVIIRYARPKFLLGWILAFIITAIGARCFFYFNNNIGYYVFTFSRIDSLAIGALLAYLVRTNHDLIKKYVYSVFFFSLFVIVLIISTGFLHNSNQYFATFGYTVIALFFASILVFCISSFEHNYIKLFFNNRVLKMVGKIAYGLYVYHFILYILLKPLIERSINNVVHNSIFSKVSVSLIIVSITFLLSYWSYLFYERRFLLLKNRFTK